MKKKQKLLIYSIVIILFSFFSLININTSQAAGCGWACLQGSNECSDEWGDNAYIGKSFSTDEDNPPDCSFDNRPECAAYEQPVCCCTPEDDIRTPGNSYSQIKNNENKIIQPKFEAPDLQIDLPINFGDVSCVNNDQGGFACTVSWIGDYVSYIYRYGLSVAGILAAIMLMAGGIIWLTSGGDSSKVTQAKNIIIGSITGLLILFSAYVILNQINPELTKLDPITIGYKSSDLGGDTDTPINQEDYEEGLDTLIAVTGIECGADSYDEMIKKATNKVTYERSSLRGSLTPENKIYLDCSSFASYISTCAGKPNVPTFTGNIFSNKTPFNGDLSSLKAGDLIGWVPEDNPKNWGHVYIYLGNGMFGDVNGAEKDGVGYYTLDKVMNAVYRWTGDTKAYIRRP